MPHPEFLDHLMDACDLNAPGFYFEERGCYGMALALHEEFERLGLPARFVEYDDFNHVVVEIRDAFGGVEVDYRGADATSFGQSRRFPLDVDRETFLRLAVEASNWSADDIEADRDLAREAIAAAREMARPERSPGPTP